MDQAAHRLHEPEILAVRRSHRCREHPIVRWDLRIVPGHHPRAHDAHARAPRPRARGGDTGPVTPARLAAEARLLGGTAARAFDRVSRRADEWRRSDHATPILGDDL